MYMTQLHKHVNYLHVNQIVQEKYAGMMDAMVVVEYVILELAILMVNATQHQKMLDLFYWLYK